MRALWWKLLEPRQEPGPCRVLSFFARPHHKDLPPAVQAATKGQLMTAWPSFSLLPHRLWATFGRLWKATPIQRGMWMCQV